VGAVRPRRGRNGFTCQLGLHLTAWSIGGSGGFLYSGTGDVHPTSLTVPCVAFFPGATPFTAVDSGFPAAPGHYNLGSIGEWSASSKSR
jgi:hypothetical protein